MTNILFLLVFCLLVGILAGAAQANDDRTESLLFAIEFNGRSMGEHAFQITYRGEAVEVQSNVNMRYRIAFIPVFRYQHTAIERWQDGCLTTLESETNDDGKRFALTGERAASGFAVAHRAPLPEQTLIDDACPATFAYWQPELLARSALINAQTGRLEPVIVTSDNNAELEGRPAEQWTIRTASGGVIDLWYSRDNGQWLRLEHQSEDGTLVYRRQNA